MLKTLTVAKHVLRESLRKKSLFIFGLFAIILVISSIFLDTVNQEDKIKLVERISLGAMAFFGIMAAIFLPATSLPVEIEEKTIQGVVTKPIGRFNFLLGKILGFTSVLFVLFLLMGTFSWAVIKSTAKGKTLTADRSFIAERIAFSGENADKVNLLETAIQEGKTAWIGGQEDIKSTWSWKGVLPEALPQGEVTLRVINTTSSGGARQTELEVAYFTSPGKSPLVQKIKVEDDLPIKLDFSTLAMDTARSVEPRPPLKVEIRQMDADYTIGVDKESFKILASPGSFQFNYIKCLFLLFLELILMVTITVMGSTFLSTAVTITLSFFVYLTGHMLEFIKTILKSLETTGHLVAPHTHGHLEVKEHLPWLIKMFKFFFHWIVKLFPDLKKFDTSSLFIQGTDIPKSLLTENLTYMVTYVAIAMLAAYLFFRKKEFR